MNLYSAVELVAVYRLANINCKAFESLLHKFLARARIDLALADRFGGKVQPREWCLVSLPVVEEVVERIKDGSISDYVFLSALSKPLSMKTMCQRCGCLTLN
jgi:hypothetical protein